MPGRGPAISKGPPDIQEKVIWKNPEKVAGSRFGGYNFNGYHHRRFPGETEEEFEELPFTVAKRCLMIRHLFLYSIRKGTPAENLRIGTGRNQTRDLICLRCDQFVLCKKNAAYVGKIKVLVDGPSKRQDPRLTAAERKH